MKNLKILGLVSVVLLVVIFGVLGVVEAIDETRPISKTGEQLSLTSTQKTSILKDLKKSDKIDDEVVEQLEDDNTARVIVSFDNSNIKRSYSLNKKRSKIKSNQEEVLNNLGSGNYKILHQYKTLNALALEVNAQGLKELESLGFVDEIQEDSVHKLLLVESVPLINADDVWGDFEYTGEGVSVCVVDTGVDYTHPAIGSSSCSLSYNEEILTTPIESYNGVHPYPDGPDETRIITMPGYSSIAVHFEQIGLEKNGYDYIEILDGNNNIVQTISSDEAWNPEQLCDGDIYDIWSTVVPGDTIKIHLIGDSYPEQPATCYGYKIDKVADGISWQNCGDFLGGYDFVNNDRDPMDDEGHGTHVAGIITSDDVTYKGVAPDAGIVAVKVCNGVCLDADIAAGIDWCINNKDVYNIKVVSLSLGIAGSKYNSVCTGTETITAVNTAYDAGLFVAVASGNDGYIDGINSPACARGATSVGATWDYTGGEGWYYAQAKCDDTPEEDTLTCYSNRGEFLDLLAPGGVIMTTDYNWEIGNDFTPGQGTSSACPHVAGLAALMLQADDTLTPDMIESNMKENSVLIYDDDNSRNNGFGSGLYFPRIDAYAAVEAVIPDSLSITVDDLDFGSIDPSNYNTIDVPIIIESSTSYSVTTKANGEYFCSDYPDCTANKFSISQLEWDNSGSWEDYTQTEAEIASGTSGTIHHINHKLTIPAEQSPNTYTTNLIFKVTAA